MVKEGKKMERYEVWKELIAVKFQQTACVCVLGGVGGYLSVNLSSFLSHRQREFKYLLLGNITFKYLICSNIRDMVCTPSCGVTPIAIPLIWA